MCSCCGAFLCPFFGFGVGDTCGQNESDMARRHLDIFIKAIRGEGMAPSARVQGKYAPPRAAAVTRSERTHLVGRGTNSTAVWTAQYGLNFMSSTLMLESIVKDIKPVLTVKS